LDAPIVVVDHYPGPSGRAIDGAPLVLDIEVTVVNPEFANSG